MKHEMAASRIPCSNDEHRSPKLELHLRQFSIFNERIRRASLTMSRWSHVFFSCFASNSSSSYRSIY